MAGLSQHCIRSHQCRRKVYVCWNMRGVLRLRAFSVHSYANTEDLHLVTKAFCVGFASFVKLVVGVFKRATIITPVTAFDRNMLLKVWTELDYRCDMCRMTKGAHIEHLYYVK
ncbi:hypothetical protein AVEN_142095-1 [Araneus ventricosus]|uniref:Uncharacterized protein n=1 Tax=Araneus ventricosus TaxID=182803 RepID=A0A4Y2I0W3_ARAVE|nr:hypothetical protein AVEN_142095-1 [Araneus ventricosus]